MAPKGYQPQHTRMHQGVILSYVYVCIYLRWSSLWFSHNSQSELWFGGASLLADKEKPRGKKPLKQCEINQTQVQA